MKKGEVTKKVRDLIPTILKEERKGLKFDQLFSRLKAMIPELVNEHGEDRVGVLRGIINKLPHYPVPHLSVEKREDGVYYVYVEGEYQKLIAAVKNFIRNLDEERLIKNIDPLSLNKNERTNYHALVECIAELKEIIEEETK
ncbi:hypothetical protein HNR63_000224 [Anoxybacillus kamchatkensis]|uniref:hypothetical protein n=1 Tax=Anoxybacillus ayderensis TaxID=265546 RepID=UPI0015EC5A17|nr:hypothetical protein [Anoxybacillus ayderensis]MBA2877197.1 hypothetical protein [Anoxybacillus ayderensis]